jgi:hypothetical protein
MLKYAITIVVIAVIAMIAANNITAAVIGLIIWLVIGERILLKAAIWAKKIEEEL